MRYVKTKRCPVCGMNIVESAFDAHVDRHGSMTAGEYRQKFSPEALRARDAEVARLAEENRRAEIARAEENRRLEARARAAELNPTFDRDPRTLLPRLGEAVKALRDALREFPGTEFDPMLRETARLRAGTPGDLAAVQRFLDAWCSEYDFGKTGYDVADHTSARNVIFDKIVNAAEKVERILDDILNCEVTLDAPSLRFLVACIDAGCVPVLVRGCGSESVRHLREQLLADAKAREGMARSKSTSRYRP